MNERERLIGLIRRFCSSEYATYAINSGLVSFMLANGVIVSPVKVGDTVYVIYSNIKAHPPMELLEETTVTEVSTQRIWVDGNYFDYDDIGKTVFLTREDAEKALEEGRGCNE